MLHYEYFFEDDGFDVVRMIDQLLPMCIMWYSSHAKS